MSGNIQQSLIDHLDARIHGNGSPEMEKLINEDPETAREWYHLQEASEALQHTGLYEQVGHVKAEWKASPHAFQANTTSTEQGARPNNGAVVRTLYRNVLRAAACIFIISGGATLYKYSSTNPTNFYSKYYTSYNLNASRGVGAEDVQEQAYTDKNWANVIDLFDKSKDKTNKSYFLAGMADLELKKYDDAIGKFQHIIAANALSGGDYFQDEAEFYLAMSWLGRGDANEALPLLEKIRDNPRHSYHNVVVKMSTLDIRILEYKSK
ncbi:MAG TPA: hypothetical protein VNU72_00545 [Puia sp.]|nr:hypothetical protein [Puia sp.]